MAKKITFTLLVGLLIASALVFVSCKQDPGSQIGPAPSPNPDLVAVENKLGEVSANKVYNGDFESGSESDIQADGSTASIVAGQGIDGSSAMEVLQSENYGQVYIDITSEYARGKSYYVEAWFKNLGGDGTRTSDLTARLCFTIVSGAVMDAVKEQGWEAYYDCDDIYDGGWLSDDAAEEIFQLETNSGAEDFSSGEWVKVSGILDAVQIDQLLANTTAKYGKGAAQTIQYLLVGFYVGTYPEQDGYHYLIDNVQILDLNKEIKKQGRTYKPAVVEEEEEEEEEEV